MKQINEKRVAYLYEAINRGSIRAAADKLNTAPSAVSRQIALLEEELATTLVERHRKGVTPTDAGAIVLRYYRELLSSEESCISELQALEGLQIGHIILAVGEGFVGDLMSGPLPEFNRLYPNLTLSINMVDTNEVIRQVEEDEAHIGLLFHPANHPGVRSQVISYQPMCAIVPLGHVLAQQSSPVKLEMLLDYPVALLENHFGIRQLLAVAEFQERLRFKPILTTSSIAVLKYFVRSQLGMTFLPEFVVAREIADKQLVAIPIDQEVLTRGEAHMVTRLGRQLSEGPNQLLLHLTSWMKAFSSS
ncbi:LysR family transcriptional regulator [Candidatus Endobugula sertula]|uniref:LysR family transcriptional regulator n=1 Tax=Candidatus Endobugula sertula TaxID=62101 RepID=A0A1D2QSD8_9GAMM|nr:LysR family transcriptional regulator [Candidatus Endobugula sertula]